MKKTNTTQQENVVSYNGNNVFVTYHIDGKEIKAMYFIAKRENITKVQKFLDENKGFEAMVISKLKLAGVLINKNEATDKIEQGVLSLFS